MKPYDKSATRLLPLQVRTAYAQVLERLEDLEAENLAAGLISCGLVVKRVAGREYAYAQGRLADGANRQVYLGPADGRVRKVVERFNARKREAAELRVEIDATARMLRGSGIPPLDPVEWRVLSALAADGVFRAGGVLVGTVAFRCLAGVMGVVLPSAGAVTGDLDIAGDTLPVAIRPRPMDAQTALDRLEMGFSPMMESDPALHGSRFLSRGGEFKVEFLAPLTGRETGKMVQLPQFGVTAIPLRFLDYLIEEPMAALALGRRPILVKVPSPSRFAVHKLIVSQERRGVPLKTQKDLEQAHDLQRALATLDPDGLDDAFKEARKRGPGWVRRVDAGLRAMERMLK